MRLPRTALKGGRALGKASRPVLMRTVRSARSVAQGGVDLWRVVVQQSSGTWSAVARWSAVAWKAAARRGVMAWSGVHTVLADRPVLCGIAIGIVLTLCVFAAISARRQRRATEAAPQKLASALLWGLHQKRQLHYASDSLTMALLERFAKELQGGQGMPKDAQRRLEQITASPRERGALRRFWSQRRRR